MDGGTHLTPDYAKLPKSSTGCWTCKVRRKKCDRNSSICNACVTLQISCHYKSTKPDWMDGGARQEEMAEWLKIKVKENAHRRRAERSVAISSKRVSPSAGELFTFGGEWIVLPQHPAHMNEASPERVPLGHATNTTNIDHVPLLQTATPSTGPKSDCELVGQGCLDSIVFGRVDTILITFYFQSLFPFLFPFHQPSVLQGGRAWILELMLKSPVGTAGHDGAWEVVLAQTRDAFQVLRQALQVIDRPGITDHIHGAVRILASIMQLQRFEIAVMSFDNCRAHLSACVSLFRQILDSGGASAAKSVSPSSCFDSVISCLGPAFWTSSGKSVRAPSAEEAAFRFSSALLMFDDIIASTTLQQPPQLYDLHQSLLAAETAIDLKAAVGCENWVLLQIGRIAALDANKQQCKRAGNLDIVELVQSAMPIKASIEANLARLETGPTPSSQDTGNLLDALAAGHLRQPGTPSVDCQTSLINNIWAHAAILYLSVVVSGWQPASGEIRHHVQKAVDLLARVSPRALLRAVCWPLCVVGCLAEPGQENQLRALVQALQPLSLFGTLYKALEIMEAVWQNRDSTFAADHDLAACFRSHNDSLVLLV
ncbi:hypothetical protein LTR97_009073 [Elasticomyces elasticus]|uniref:Zn(2)-C6 fungal-type domain-containing protein n=1 Tax=Elasticomyces elasticus TaxID=574655 RepID=A0AAN7VVV9_9PEZI|nr:hypothetical protein LTR97_009073 [Elasticomyces elasticus]